MRLQFEIAQAKHKGHGAKKTIVKVGPDVATEQEAFDWANSLEGGEELAELFKSNGAASVTYVFV